MNRLSWILIPFIILTGCAIQPADSKLDLTALESSINETKAGDFGDFMVSMHKAETKLAEAERLHADLVLGRSADLQVLNEGVSAAERALEHRNDAEDAFDRLLSPIETSIEENNQILEESVARLEWIEQLHLRAEQAIPLKNIYFDFGGHRVKPTEQQKVTDLIDFLREHPVFALKLTGYADTVGSKQRNYNLAERRNNAVLSLLRQHRLPANTVISVAIGEAEGPDELKNAENRRVEIKPYIHGRYAYPKPAKAVATPAAAAQVIDDNEDIADSNDDFEHTSMLVAQ